MITQLIEFDVKKDSHVKITAKEGDINSRNLEFRLLDNSLPFSLAGRTVRCYMVKPDKRVVFNDLQILDAEDGRCVLTLTAQSLIKSGMANIELIVYEEGKKLSTIPIKMNIIKSLASDELLYSSNEFGALESALWKIDTFTETMNSKADKEELKKVSEQLDKKMNKTDTLSMANMGQDVKEAMTGGSVAVVGKNSVGSENIKHSSIDIFKTNFINCGNNLLDGKNLIQGYLKGDGTVTLSAGHRTTEIIPTNGASFITLSRVTSSNVKLSGARDIRFVEFYNQNMDPLTENFYNNNSSISESVTIPSNAWYLRVTIQSGYDDGKSMLYFGESGKYSYFEEHDKIINDLNLSQTTLNIIQNRIRKQLMENKIIDLDSLNFVEKIGSNLWNNENYTIGYIQANGDITNDDGYVTSDFKLIKDTIISAYRFKTEQATQTYIRKIAFYDENFRPLTDLYYDNSSRTVESVTLNNKATYFRLSIPVGFNNDVMIVYGSEAPNEYQPYKYRLKNICSENNSSNPLEEKILFNFGDSIAAGDGNKGKGYAEILGEMYGMTVYDFAVGGATLGDTASNNITTQVDNAIAKGITPHYILIEGGTNDISSQNTISVGEIGSTFTLTDFDKTTTTGGLEYCLYKLKNAFPDAKIVFVSVHKMGSRNYDRQVERQNACINVCEKWCIPVADIGKRGNLNTFISCMHKYTNPTESQPNGDRTHPNGLGYRIYYIPIIYSVLIAI